MYKIILILISSIALIGCGNSKSPNKHSDSIGGYHNYNDDIHFGSQEEWEVNVGDRVFYALNSSRLDSDSQDVLLRQAAWLKRNSHLKIVIEGHCDERGPREYNLGLGERRANAVKKFLISAGIDADRISTISYGKERPAVMGSDESAWSKNRRAVTVIE